MYGLIKQVNGHGYHTCGRKAASDDPMVDEVASLKDKTIGFMTHCYQVFCKDRVHNF